MAVALRRTCADARARQELARACADTFAQAKLPPGVAPRSRAGVRHADRIADLVAARRADLGPEGPVRRGARGGARTAWAVIAARPSVRRLRAVTRRTSLPVRRRDNMREGSRLGACWASRARASAESARRRAEPNCGPMRPSVSVATYSGEEQDLLQRSIKGSRGQLSDGRGC